MHALPTFCIPDFGAQVIAMPMHHRKRKYARALLDAAAVIVLPKLSCPNYPAAKEHVEERCKYYRLSKWQTGECVDRCATELRRGRSASVAVAEGIKLAKLYANTRQQHGGDAA